MGKKSHCFLDEDGLNSRRRKEEGWERHLGARQGSGFKLEKPCWNTAEAPDDREERGQTLKPVCTGSSWYGNLDSQRRLDRCFCGNCAKSRSCGELLQCNLCIFMCLNFICDISLWWVVKFLGVNPVNASVQNHVCVIGLSFNLVWHLALNLGVLNASILNWLSS